jgi:hypothetical protein
METEKVIEKPDIFAAGIAEQRLAEIPAGELDEVFGNDVNPEIMSIPLENPVDENDVNFDEEEAEEVKRALGHEAIYAEGVDFGDLQTVAKAVGEQPETIDEQTVKTLVALEHTELLALLAGGEDGKMNWIKTVIDRHTQSTTPETETEVSTNTDYGDFEVADYLS